MADGRGALGGFALGASSAVWQRLEPSGSLWVVFPKKPFVAELGVPYLWLDVQKAGLSAGLVDNKVAGLLVAPDVDPLRRSSWRGRARRAS